MINRFNELSLENEIKEISYIIEDEGESFKIFRNSGKILIYITHQSKSSEKLVDSEYFKEFYDRLKEISSENLYNIYYSNRDHRNIIILSPMSALQIKRKSKKK